MVLLLGACVGERDIEPPGPAQVSGVDTAQPGAVGLPGLTRYEPQVCGDMTWTTTNAARTGDVDMAVVPRPAGAEVLVVPVTGGALSVYDLDNQMNTQAVGASLSIDDGFMRVSASLVRGELVATALDRSGLHVDVLASDLSKAVPITTLPSGLTAKTAFQSADGIDFVPVADGQGLRLERFDAQWQTSTVRAATTEPATGLTAAAMDRSTVAVWSTQSVCYMMTMFTPQPGPLDKMAEACASPRLAIDSATQVGRLVYEADDGVHVTTTRHVRFEKGEPIGPGGTSPRVLFDGQRFWISYLNKRGDIVIGYLDEDDSGRFVSTQITSDIPSTRAYELTMVAGHVWAVSFDNNGYRSTRMCVAPISN